MAAHDIAAAIERVQSVLSRRPEVGLHDDAPAAACWEGSLRVIASHANGVQIATDMPRELGGDGQGVTPGWLMRASLASCAVTRIAMTAATEGIELSALEVRASSRSDTRGLLAMADASGDTVSAGLRDIRLRVRIAAHGVDETRLRALVDASHACSPTARTLQDAPTVQLDIEVVVG